MSPAQAPAPPTGEVTLTRRRPQRVRRSRTWNIVLAVFFFILGVVGILIPVMPQVLFFAMSALFLSLVSRPVRRAVRRFLHRHPSLAHRYNVWRHKRRLKRLKRIRKARELATKLRLRREGER